MPALYRKRLIPLETVKLTYDEIVYLEEGVIVTKWKPIKPRKDIGSGESCYLIDKGIKVSRFYDNEEQFIYWYCDIIETKYVEETSEYIFTDLLVDVKVYADGFVKVLDIDELTASLNESIIDVETLKTILNRLALLLDIVYGGGLYELCGKYLDYAR